MDKQSNSTLASEISIEDAAYSRLRDITAEAAALIKAHPGMSVDHVTVTKDGIYTGICNSLFSMHDPLLETITSYRAGKEAFYAIPSVEITGENEDKLVEETYGAWQEKLLKWDQPAGSVEGALAAVKLMHEEDVFVDEVGKRMADAVIKFLQENCTLSPKSAPDPVIAAIHAYDAGNKAFEAIKEDDWDSHGGQEAVIEKTYGPPMRVVDNWDQPCTSMEGAIAALRHAAQEADNFSCSDSLTAMVNAALAYLEGARS